MESWRNINAIDDLIFEILNTMSHLVIAGLRGNAGAGGAMLALAADHIYAPASSSTPITGAWAISMDRRLVGQTRALELTLSCKPIGTQAAQEIGFLDDAFGEDTESFVKPLASYRAEELERMWVNFFGPYPAYHEARRRFVFKENSPPQRSQLPIEAEAEEASTSDDRFALFNIKRDIAGLLGSLAGGGPGWHERHVRFLTGAAAAD
jgi:putative two-component system protein, hydrogenase maturation factor HypX/HoxX